MLSERDSLFLRECPDFAALTDRQLRALGTHMVPRHALAGAVLIHFDATPSGMMALSRGQVEVTIRPRDRSDATQFILGHHGVIGESAFGHGGSVDFRVVALGDCDFLELAPAARAAILQEKTESGDLAWDPNDLARFFHERATIAAYTPWLVARLRRSAVFSRLPVPSMPHLYELIEGAELRTYPEAWSLDVGDEPPGIGVLLSGEIVVTRKSESGAAVAGGVLRRGDCFCDLEVVSGANLTYRLEARERTEVVLLSTRQFRRLLSGDAFRRSLRSAEGLGDAIREATEATDRGRVELLMLTADRALAVSTERLTHLLAEAIAAKFSGDRVAVVRLVPQTSDTAHAGSGELSPRGPISLLDLPLREGAEALGAVHAIARRLAPDFDLVFLDASGVDLARRDAVAPALTQLIQLFRGAAGEHGMPLKARCAIQFTAVLGDDGDPLNGGGQPYPATATRIRLRHIEGDRSYAAQPPEAKATLDRWARAVTERRVGIALGGGGAWGYAHIALIRALVKRHVPIDLVSGSSFGAVVGAYYCALGLPGLALLETKLRGGMFAAASSVGFVSSAGTQLVVDREMQRNGRPGVRLEDLDVPFIPVACDVNSGSQVSLRRGTVGFGVRASGALPPFFAAVELDGARYIDGGVICNVPAGVLRLEGADLVVACNIVPLPAESVNEAASTGLIVRTARGALKRGGDVWRALLIMMHSAGSDSASDADEIYKTRAGRHLAMSFFNGSDIVRETEDDPAFQPAIQRIADRWSKLTQRR